MCADNIFAHSEALLKLTEIAQHLRVDLAGDRQHANGARVIGIAFAQEPSVRNRFFD